MLIKQKASSNALIKDDTPIVVDLAVNNIQFALHKKPNKPDCMKVTYNCGLNNYNEYILFEHVGFGQRKAATWWRARTALAMPQTTEEALEVAHRLMVPCEIKVWVNKPYPEILNITFPEVPF